MRYTRIFQESGLDKSTQIFTDAVKILDDISKDTKFTDKLNSIMADVNSELKAFMQKRGYIQKPDVENFALAIQKSANERLSKTPELSSALITLCMLLSYKLKANEKKEEEPAENTNE